MPTSHDNTRPIGSVTGCCSTVDLLLARFPDVLLLPLLVVIKLIGYSVQTARNELVKKTFPIPTTREKGRVFAQITDVAIYLAEKEANREHPVIKKKIGRPYPSGRQHL